MKPTVIAGIVSLALSSTALAQETYDRSIPLNARVVHRADTVSFIREKVTFDGWRGSRVPALVAIPKAHPGRRPVVVLIDGIGGWKERWWQSTSWNRGRILIDSLMDAGFAVAMADAPASGERTFENDFVSAESFIARPDQWREMGLQNAIETRRLIDYLVTRADIDSTRIGMLGLSHGGMMTFILAAGEPRVKSAVAGLTPMQRIPDDLLPAHHAPRIQIPFLLFATSDDAWYTEAQVRSVFGSIPARDRTVKFYGGGHRPPPEYAADAVDWFRRTLR